MSYGVSLGDPTVDHRREVNVGVAQRPYHGLKLLATGSPGAVIPSVHQRRIPAQETAFEGSFEKTRGGEERGIHGALGQRYEQARTYKVLPIDRNSGTL